ncbi:hypothetical protein U1Q18_010172 [Sarracenia purpurea var. burkii]
MQMLLFEEPTATEEFAGNGYVLTGEERWSDGGAVVAGNGGAGLLGAGGPDEEDNRWPPWLKLLRSMQVSCRFTQDKMQYVLLGLYERRPLFSLSRLTTRATVPSRELTLTEVAGPGRGFLVQQVVF